MLMNCRLVAALVLASFVAALPLSAQKKPASKTGGRSAAASAAATAAEREYLLERVDDAAVVQLYADGFEKLPLEEKALIWHLYQAAIAGRDMFIDQKHRSALAMRSIL